MNNSKFSIAVISFLIGLQAAAQTPDQIDPNAAGMIENVQHMQKDMARLKGLKPLTSQQLKEWLPETLGELERITFSVGNGNTGILALMGSYNTTDVPEFLDGNDEVNTKNKTLVIEVMDGAGSGAEMFSAMVMMSNMNFESEDDRKQVKHVNVNGIRAQQTYHKQSNKTGLNFTHMHGPICNSCDEYLHAPRRNMRVPRQI